MTFRKGEYVREALKPRDMIDVQGFMWCTFGGGWTPEEVTKAKLKHH